MLPKAWTSGWGVGVGMSVYANKQSYMNSSISYMQCPLCCVFDVGCCHGMLRLMQTFLPTNFPFSGT